jgi:hypothetical protein
MTEDKEDFMRNFPVQGMLRKRGQPKPGRLHLESAAEQRNMALLFSKPVFRTLSYIGRRDKTGSWISVVKTCPGPSSRYKKTGRT